jgi:hypothetical protein
MLLRLNDWVSRNDDISKPHRGVVISNGDPKKLGRIKVEIEGFLQGLHLPWIYPKNPYFLGGGNGSISFSVPEEGSEVIVEFPFKDIYFGFYTGHWPTKKHPNEFDVWSMDAFPYVTFNESYPESYGFRDSNGNYFRVNKIKNTMELYHKSSSSDETRITIRDDGQIDIFTIGDFNITNSGNINLNTTGIINILVPLKGARISFNGLGGIPLVTATVNAIGDLTAFVLFGGATVEVTKSVTLAAGLSVSIIASTLVSIYAGGSASVTAVGKVDIVAGGDVSVNAGGIVDITAEGSVLVNAVGRVDIVAGGEVSVSAGGEASVAAVGNATIHSLGVTTVHAEGNAILEAGANVDITAGGVINVTSGGLLNVMSGGLLNVMSGGVLTITAPTILVN